jgi:hypothetical protein
MSAQCVFILMAIQTVDATRANSPAGVAGGFSPSSDAAKGRGIAPLATDKIQMLKCEMRSVQERPDRHGYPDFQRELTSKPAAPAHAPEKWVPFFGEDHAPPKGWSVMPTRRKVITLSPPTSPATTAALDPVRSTWTLA